MSCPASASNPTTDQPAKRPRTEETGPIATSPACMAAPDTSAPRPPMMTVPPSIEKITLYSYWRSSCSWRVRMALNLKELPYENRPVNLILDGGEQNKEEYEKLNPNRAVPTLVMDLRRHPAKKCGQPDPEGPPMENPITTLTLTQSMAIIEFLEDLLRDRGVRLLPVCPLARARIRAMALQIVADTQPVQNARVIAHVGKPVDQGGLGGSAPEWANKWITTGLVALEKLAIQHAGKYMYGDTISLADICLIPQLYNARRFNVDLSAMPTLLRVEANLQEIEAIAKAHPDLQPDAPKQE
ncbi:maleylacetoacetate isomerase [Fonticula alba]|uniref:Maleylacetoacetate isomerase n=1 Tax=Fonticula alba TaxID=691883 RepID=A0A058ZH91_FONAL|nr:maleylacetoacetate isomerase [Fonticula alba]KCV73331.1 maleylacetoacetate isomerase [Fonticula alba]|eukprot:XP_009493032.1 maleylacetoacetate isomerase [Fonticula alba]